MSRRRYRGRRQNRSGMFLVSTVVIVLMLMVSIKCVELKEKQDQYVVRQEELKQQIADEEARAEELEELKKYDSEDIYVIGGDSIYRQLLPYCDVAHVTKIDYAYEADSYFPNLDEMSDWTVERTSEELTYFDLEYMFVKYVRQ